MAKNQLTKYIWLVDTIRRHKRITREEINARWVLSPLSEGKEIPRRTFFNYRQAIEDLFNIIIECDPATFEYYIEEDEHTESANNWLLDSAATNEMITSSRDIANRVFLENVPSAREYLPIVIDAIRSGTALKFDYHPYTRSLPTRDVTLEPYFTKIFKQRWYVVGRNIKEDKIKTYALDRMRSATLLNSKFEMPADFDPAEYFRDAFGIVVDKGEPKIIKIKAEGTQAKYFRALPLHHSQTEMVNDQYSIFQYRMRITRDLVTELLSYGSAITVLEPRELKAMIKTELERALQNY